MTRLRTLHRSTSGSGFLQWVILVGCFALAATGAYLTFGSAIVRQGQTEARKVATLTGTSGGPESAAGNGAPVNGCTDSSCPPGSGNCFVAGTPVLTPKGLVPIEDIREGDPVVSRDVESGAVRVATVTRTYVRVAPSLTAVRIDAEGGGDETLYATPEHRFWTLDEGWREAGELRANEPLLDAAGHERRVRSSEPIAATAVVFNFEVDPTHTYFVGATPVLVHNPRWYKPWTWFGDTSAAGSGQAATGNAPANFAAPTHPAPPIQNIIADLTANPIGYLGNANNPLSVTFTPASVNGGIGTIGTNPRIDAPPVQITASPGGQPAWLTPMQDANTITGNHLPTTTLPSLPYTTNFNTPGSNPSFWTTPNLTGCSIVIGEDQNGNVHVAHVRPPQTFQGQTYDGATMYTPLTAMAQQQGLTNVVVYHTVGVDGQGNPVAVTNPNTQYAATDNVAIVGVRDDSGHWTFYAQARPRYTPGPPQGHQIWP